MSKIQLYIAVTLDGFISREDGSLDWLMGLPNPNHIDHGYNSFINDVDLVLMGRKTYDEVLGYGVEWPYSNCKTYVFTYDSEYSVKTENTFIIHEVSEKLIEQLRKETKKNIWLADGGNLITQFHNAGAIDELTISIIPVILGRGIKLFQGVIMETEFELIKSESFETGVVNLNYCKK